MIPAGHKCCGIGAVSRWHFVATCECGWVSDPALSRPEVVDLFAAHVLAVELVDRAGRALTDFDRPTRADRSTDD